MIAILSRGKRSPIEFGNFTDVGTVRSENEDYYGFFETELGSLFIVCDGMGGHVGGKRASRLAVETISQVVSESVDTDASQVIQRALFQANHAIRKEIEEQQELEGMGTTCVLLLINTQKKPLAWRAHIGDSRLYRIRDAKIELLTQDHSMVGEMQRRGLISEEEAEDHPQKNVITRALGVREEIEPEISTVEVCKGDRFILCTDGISGPIPAIDIEDQSTDQSPQNLAERLVRLANERSGDDNATVQVIDSKAGPKAPKPMRVPVGSKDLGRKKHQTQILGTPAKQASTNLIIGGGAIVLLIIILLALFLNGGPVQHILSFFSPPTTDLTNQEDLQLRESDMTTDSDSTGESLSIEFGVSITDSVATAEDSTLDSSPERAIAE